MTTRPRLVPAPVDALGLFDVLELLAVVYLVGPTANDVEP